jgi:hypothetical protein
MNKICKHVEKDGFHRCGSYAFNLYKDDIDQGELCDVHYWQERALKAEALLEPTDELHSCPYAEEIHGNYEKVCDCDEEATRQCAQDI